MNIKTILSKPLPVIWFRVVQLVYLKIYQRTKFWEKTTISVSDKIATSKTTWKEKSLLFCAEFRGYEDVILNGNRQYIRKSSESILKGNIPIFDSAHRFEKPYVWNTDWRVGHKWKNNYFKEYGFYEKEKPVEYDVKFPWELSRLSFLIPVARHYLLDNKTKNLKYLSDILTDWKQNNPLAYSVNWYPMEVSIRIINLIQLRELLLIKEEANDVINLLNEILILHGVFLWRNIEYTDVRGNHYTANLTALLLLGIIFKGFYKEAKKWQSYALDKVETEFHLQFIQDGVNFEKSIPYHRLVVELYLICFLIMDRLGIKIKTETKILLKNACLFSKSYTKPNCLAPIIGDNDSASVFQNDNLALNNHTNLLQLASLFFNEESINSTANIYMSSLELFGVEKVKNFSKTQITARKLLYYDKGGFVIVKNQDNFFITDVGEVGMKGRGGHGHNDLYSFELMLNGKDFIVDPGCYTYTGNLMLKNEMKSSSYHNILTIDNEEIAPLIGDWGIANIAIPYDVIVNQNEEEICVSAKHKGYNRLDDSVKYQRTFCLDKESFRLSCFDIIKCRSEHNVTRHIHFSENVKLKVLENGVLASLGKNHYSIVFDSLSTAYIENYWLSYNYGHKIASKKVVLRTNTLSCSELHFTVEKTDSK
ncbi:alginate lyase family protein [Flagellimonas pacifica]|uniref:Heparinase II/III N-terminus n=1 Tax=Flagellimonas pacifica TaxID=1247520 RepID=A0A285MCW7_9FLAO|nr:alginate lyase family protein [Allomuricauda parva]SNY95024.1 Heparinase II/III N-terminus [Allomuricauda parva]